MKKINKAAARADFAKSAANDRRQADGWEYAAKRFAVQGKPDAAKSAADLAKVHRARAQAAENYKFPDER